MKNFSVFSSIVVIFATVNATNYCSKDICAENEKHVACGHSGRFDSSCPSNAKMVPITNALKQVLVNAHNAKRNFIAGGGDPKHSPVCRMATMEWDDELASLAALNVKKCKIAHDQCVNTDAFKYSGQNLAWRIIDRSANHGDQLKNIVESWYSEVKNSRQSYIDSYPEGFIGPPYIGHFTVMMADRNIRVGCAAATYGQQSEDNLEYLVACNYATSNMPGFTMYKKCAKPASSCKTGKNPQYPNLCSASEKYDVNNWFETS